MKKHIGNLLKFIISLGIGVGLVFWSLKDVSTAQKQMIVDTFKKADYFWLLLLMIFGLGSNFFRAQRWRLLLKPIGYSPNYWNTFSAVMAMFFFNLLFPRLGEIMRCTILYKYEKVPVEKSIGTMVLERVIDLFCIMILGILILIFEYQRFYSFFAEIAAKINFIKLGIAGGIAIIIGGIVLYFLNKKKAVHDEIVREEHVIIAKLKGLWQGLISIKDLEEKWEFIFHTFAIWICYILMPYFGFRCMEETAHLGFTAAMASVFFGGFAMVLTQGGVGAFQIVIQKILVSYGIGEIIALSYGWISWSVQTFFVIIGGILSLIFLAIYNKSKKQTTEHAQQ
ncbi:MAG TPA: lysylphosphatidylglycerol synthase transmembrane domain-containing protein [Chitinophagales bacterium]|nr:lysylphosphatidylglycerol synthase transmembrane domain-containing protein [Chitinophagales bacterium]HMW12323.1 lysylphosphatidylglycerol synthase transmembrane domain-containing protein [Chitinophagales bacterium]HMX59789.1 lysylphosphatidylglycerol synthase transmembrane domain-containing protein [Chitinophagales bacterium]HMZ33445.1 lysylphosphatidylglycerol synthase transmembrane domain-containing protein [Chitinophagales bacterium]HNA38706.1 lysylphosphatidylglycerol synthase transmemb